MALRLVVLAALAVQAVLAEPSHLRGLGANRTTDAAAAATPLNGTGNMTEAEVKTMLLAQPQVQPPGNISDLAAVLEASAEVSTENVNIMTLYHLTSPEIADKILVEGFRPGSFGFCGGAIYFMNTPHIPITKVLLPTSHHGAIVEARVDMGRMKTIWNHYCGGWQTALTMGFNSIKFNPGDGDEFIIYDKHRVISTRRWS
mmetsp:Transcript_92944/g.240083  ORF Transcript_92944/g.240083 Transcript_92944/m.240083 type:complete len:201 (+) Transcript_92944:86-688(+)